MTLRIIDQADRLDAAVARLEAGLLAWAGDVADMWRDRAGGYGTSYARAEAVYLFLERDDRDVHIGAALSDGDRPLVSLRFDRREPARRREHWALAEDETGAVSLMIATAALERQNVRDALPRLAGAAQIKRAQLGHRDFVLIGPLGTARDGEALALLAALHPEALRAIGAEDADGASLGQLYRAAKGVRREHKVAAKAATAVQARLTGTGFVPDHIEVGPLSADLAFSRDDERIAVEILGQTDAGAIALAVGRLAMIAPRAAGIDRILVLPEPELDGDAALSAFEGAFTELALAVVLVGFDRGSTRLTLAYGADQISEDAREALLA
jgi:hypothetical protein